MPPRALGLGIQPTGASAREGRWGGAPAGVKTPRVPTAGGEPRSVMALVIYTQARFRAFFLRGSCIFNLGHQYCLLGSRQGESPRSAGWQEEAPVRLGSSQAERVCWSWPARDRLQGPREAGRGPSWKYRGPLQLQQAALPSRGGGTDGGMAGSGRAGPQGHRVRSNCLCLQARGDLSRARETQSRQSPWGASVLALACSPPA